MTDPLSRVLYNGVQPSGSGVWPIKKGILHFQRNSLESFEPTEYFKQCPFTSSTTQSVTLVAGPTSGWPYEHGSMPIIYTQLTSDKSHSIELSSCKLSTAKGLVFYAHQLETETVCIRLPSPRTLIQLRTSLFVSRMPN